MKSENPNSKYKQFVNENRLIFIYILCVLVLEFSAQLSVNAKPYFTKFWVTILFILIPVSLLFSLKRYRLKKFFSMLFLFIQIVIVIATNFLYNATGTDFQKEMVYQRNDAFGTIEQLDISYVLVVICLLTLIAFITAQVVDRKKRKKNNNQLKGNKGFRIWTLAICIISLCTFSIMPILDGISEKKKTDYHYKLLANSSGTQMYGSTTNIFYELVEFGASSGINTSDMDKLEGFIYNDTAATSKYNGISEGNNLIMILVESLDTHVLERYSIEQTKQLFPNLTQFIDDGIYATNFRQKEKTDSSEVFSLLSSYPTGKYVNYGFENNTYPFAMPNLFKQKAAELGKEPIVNSFHQNKASFYNRDKLHVSLGFDKLYGIKEMLPYGMVNDWDTNNPIIKGERSLDSLTIETMKDVMFPKVEDDQNFFSFWITFTMHGFYEKRDNLKEEGYYARLDKLKLFPEGDKNENYYRTYAAAVMDFDKALGTMMDDLSTKGLLDDTTIVMFSDHNTYYNNLTEYAKGLKDMFDPEGFRIPLIIYDNKLKEAMQNNGDGNTITKFTTTTDILPTICDLFNIPIWQNMYFGSTVFNDDIESICYSKMYNIFFNDKMTFFTLSDFRNRDYFYDEKGNFLQKLFDDELELFIQRATLHLDKLYFIDKIFYTDYFADGKNEYRIPQKP